MAKRVIIIGSTGMLGHVVLRKFTENSNFSVYDISYRTKRRSETIILDVSNFEALKGVITRLKPEIIINCVGVLIGGSKISPMNAILLNSALPHFLLDLSRVYNFKVIHVSTDCVFSGTQGNYNEYSFKDADDIYGRTKSLGEIYQENALTIRTSIIGPELKEQGEGLLHWFLTTKEKELNGYKNVFWSGVTTLELASAIEFAVNNDIKGVWNLTNGKVISKFELLNLLNRFIPSKQQKTISMEVSKKSNKSLSTVRDDISFDIINYTEMTKKMFDYIKLYVNDYPYYYL